MILVFLSRPCPLVRISASKLVKDVESTGGRSLHQVGSCTVEEVRSAFPYPWLQYFLTNIRVIKCGHHRNSTSVF